MGVTEIKKYTELANALATEKLVVVDCYTSWCGPCKKIAPLLEELSEYHPTVSFYKVNIDTVEKISKVYTIQSIPTILFLQNDVEIDRVVGANMSKITAAIEQHA